MLTIDKFREAVTTRFRWLRVFLWWPTAIAASLFLVMRIVARLFFEGRLPD
jgi:hypothetical protein